jgi:predicted phosphodiesterase
MSSSEVLPSQSAAPTARVTLAVVSDMHCRLSTDTKDSFLEVGGTRKPAGRHPVQALLNLIGSDGLTADALLLPGDFANKAQREGLSQSWDYALELGAALGTNELIPVLGNHDVDSRRSHPEHEPFYNARNLRPGFPFDDATSRIFFSDGFCAKPVGDSCEIVAVNTVIDHRDEQSAKRGSFDIARIDQLSAFLHNRPQPPIRIALMHHHPILHTGPFLSDTDVIPNGDALLSALRSEGCRLVIHGHKHLARLSVVNGVAVFASGSFAANLGVYGSAMANMFHLIDVQAIGSHVRGTIRTWVFRLGSGWAPASADYSGFPYSAGFGCRTALAGLLDSLTNLANGDSLRSRFQVSDVLSVADELAYLTPAELEDLKAGLRQQGLDLLDTTVLGHMELWRRFSGS